VITNASDLKSRRQAVALLCVSAAGTIAAIVAWFLIGWLQALFVLLLDVVTLTGLLVYLVRACEPVTGVRRGASGEARIRVTPPRPPLRTSP